MSTEGLLILLVNVLGGAALWFLKESYTEQKQKIKDIENILDRVRDTYVKKEDIREFKEELWDRLDKIEKQLHG